MLASNKLLLMRRVSLDGQKTGLDHSLGNNCSYNTLAMNINLVNPSISHYFILIIFFIKTIDWLIYESVCCKINET